MNHITENHDALLDYLYEEGDPAERLTIAKHLQECAACSVAVIEFQNVRSMLSDWTPPASLPLSAPVNQGPRRGWWRGWGPATYRAKLLSPRSRTLLQAAAGILLFLSGMAVSQLRLDYRDGAVTLRIGSDERVAPNPSVQPPTSSAVAAVDIDEVVRRVRAQLAKENPPSVDDERVLQQVRAMIGQSEQRQHRELALRLSQVVGEVDAQHRVDVERMQQDFGKQQEATMEYLVRTSGGLK
jgi:anti-sigma factor RsiW